MSFTIQHKSGLKANLPASAPLGEFYFCTDTNEVFVGTGTGIKQTNANDSKSINGVPITGTPALGKIPIGQGNGTAVFADPLVQGLQPDGTNLTTSPVNPVLIGGKGADGNLHDISVDNTGKLNIANFPATQPVSGTVTANIGTTNGLALDASVTNPQVAPGTTAPAKINIVGGKTNDVTPQYQPIPLTASGVAVKVDGSSATQPVSGTVSINAIPAGSNVIGGVELVDSAGTNKASISAAGAVKVDGSSVTQPVSAASWPLPTGAATSAKQPALGTAGTASADVITVQGIASMTALKVDGSAVTQPVSGTVTANIGTTNGLALDATLTGGTQKTKIVDSAGTNLATISAAGALKVDGSAVTQPVSGTVTANIGTTNGLALDASVTGLQVAQASTTSGQKGDLIQGAVTTGAPTYTTGTTNPLSLDTSGNLRVTGTFTPASPADTVGTTSALNALNATAQVNMAGQNGVGMFLAAGTLIGTIVPELSFDGGTTWVATQFYDPTAQTTASNIVFAANNTATTRTILHSGGASQARVRVSAFTSGTASCTLRSTSNQGAVPVINIGAAGGGSNASVSATGAAVPASATMVGGTDGTNLRALKVSTTGVLSVDGSAVTQPVSGTITANIGTTNGVALDATLTGGTQKTKLIDSGGTNVATVSAAGALKVDGSAVTQPVSGTVTANAGTGNFSVVGTASDNSADSTTKLPVIAARANAAGQTWTEGNQVPLSTNLAGEVRTFTPDISSTVTISAASTVTAAGGNFTLTNPATTLTLAGRKSASIVLSSAVSWTVGTINVYGSVDGTNFVPLDIWDEVNEKWLNAGIAANVTGTWFIEPLGTMKTLAVVAGTGWTGTVSCTIMAGMGDMNTPEFVGSSGGGLPNNVAFTGGSDGTTLRAFACDASGNQKVLNTDGVNIAAVKAASTAAGATDPALVVAISPNNTVAVTESGTWTVQPGNTQNTTPWLIAEQAVSSGGYTTFHLASAATTNATNIKSSAGQLYGWAITNTNAATRYICFHNSAGTPTAGASIFFKFGIPPSGAANVFMPAGIAFSTGIAITAVTNPADTDATAVAANDLIINLFYK